MMERNHYFPENNRPFQEICRPFQGMNDSFLERNDAFPLIPLTDFRDRTAIPSGLT